MTVSELIKKLERLHADSSAIEALMNMQDELEEAHKLYIKEKEEKNASSIS